MNCNIGCFERNLRIVVGAVLVTLAFTHHIGAWGWLGLIPLVTGLIRFCPLYTLIKRSSCCKNKKSGSACK